MPLTDYIQYIPGAEPVRTVVMHPNDAVELIWRAMHYGPDYRLRAGFPDFERAKSEPPVDAIMREIAMQGIELRRDRWVPEGKAALLDRTGKLLTVITISGH